MNKLVIIGHIGMKTAYLNIDEEEAIHRHIKSHPGEDGFGTVEEFEFEDEFDAYEIWEKD